MGCPSFCVGAVYAVGCGHPARRDTRSAVRRKGYPRRGVRIATTGVRTGFAMTGFLHGVRWISWWCVREGLCPSRTGSASTIFSDIDH